MAEAVVEDRPPMPPRYYCHICNVEINIPNQNFTCPLCAGGFVEELPSQPIAVNTGNAGGAGTSRNNAMAMANDQVPVFNRITDLNALRGEIATILLDRYGPNIEISLDPNSRRNESGVVGVGGGGGNTNPNDTPNTINTRGGGPRVRGTNFGTNVLLDFLNSLDGQFGNTSMVYLGNIGDYAWGREGIDTIVTQLLNQMETAGPPPLAREKIDEIPKVPVTQEDVDNKLQCSVCWEDFVLNEIVRKLPCSHIYHENCIVPWLDLHGTCPICRKSLNNEDEIQDDDMSGASSRQRLDGNSSGGINDGRNTQSRPAGGGGSRAPPTMRNNALDDLD